MSVAVTVFRRLTPAKESLIILFDTTGLYLCTEIKALTIDFPNVLLTSDTTRIAGLYYEG